MQMMFIYNGRVLSISAVSEYLKDWKWHLPHAKSSSKLEIQPTKGLVEEL